MSEVDLVPAGFALFVGLSGLFAAINASRRSRSIMLTIAAVAALTGATVMLVLQLSDVRLRGGSRILADSVFVGLAILFAVVLYFSAIEWYEKRWGYLRTKDGNQE